MSDKEKSKEVYEKENSFNYLNIFKHSRSCYSRKEQKKIFYKIEDFVKFGIL